MGRWIGEGVVGDSGGCRGWWGLVGVAEGDREMRETKEGSRGMRVGWREEEQEVT